MKKRVCKSLASFAVVIVLVAALAISSYAAVMSYVNVDLASNKTYALSSTFSAKSCYINSVTHNNSVSEQDMRVQFHYKSSGSWVYDVRIFLTPGSNASTTNSSIFLTNHTWRLGLSPRIEANKGVSGSGRAYY